MKDNYYTSTYSGAQIDAAINFVATQVAAPFDTSTTYIVGDYVVYNGFLYQCLTACSGAWTASNWQIQKVFDNDGYVIVDGGKHPLRVPKEYQEVEWLESNGKQGVVTNISWVQNNKVKMTVKAKNSGLFGFNASAGGYLDLRSSTWMIADSGSGSVRIDTSNFQEVIWTFGGSLTVDGVNSSTTSWTKSTGDKFSIGFITASTGYTESAYWGYIIGLDSSDNITFNGIPCYRKSDNKTGLYDTISSTFYACSGSEEFTPGADV